MIPEDADLAKFLFGLIKAIERDLEYTVTATDGPPPAWRVQPPRERFYFLIRMDPEHRVSRLNISLYRHPAHTNVRVIWVASYDSFWNIIGQMRQAVIHQLIEDHTSGPS